MKWVRQLKEMNEDIRRHYVQEREAHKEAHFRHEKMRANCRQLQLQRREYERQLRMLLKIHRSDHGEEKLELMEKIHETNTELQALRYNRGANTFNGKDTDFNSYYRHISYTRPIMMIINLALWFLLFWFGGFAIGLKITILLFAVMISLGSIFETVFSIRIKDRILIPVNDLKNGVAEISRGNYDIEIPVNTVSEINSLTKAFNEMACKLKEGEALKVEYESNRKSLIANISHDLKTPITSIQGYIEIINESSSLSQEKLERYLKIIHGNTLYLNRLIDDLFLFSKLDMQKLEFHFEEVRICPLIEDMMEEFQLDLAEKGIDFVFLNELKGDHPVKLDTKRFYQIVRNLIGNAEKYGQDRNLTIKARLYDDEDFVYLDVSDNGPGISEENLSHIFERFYRVENQRTKDLSSTGLGLSISKELIEAHGGKIFAVSKENEGSLFTVSLPYQKNNEPISEGR